jgi:hypothetical protein
MPKPPTSARATDEVEPSAPAVDHAPARPEFRDHLIFPEVQLPDQAVSTNPIGQAEVAKLVLVHRVLPQDSKDQRSLAGFDARCGLTGR